MEEYQANVQENQVGRWAYQAFIGALKYAVLVIIAGVMIAASFSVLLIPALAVTGVVILSIILYVVYRAWIAKNITDDQQYVFASDSIKIRRGPNFSKVLVEYKDIGEARLSRDPIAKWFGIDIFLVAKKLPKVLRTSISQIPITEASSALWSLRSKINGKSIHRVTRIIVNKGEFQEFKKRYDVFLAQPAQKENNKWPEVKPSRMRAAIIIILAALIFFGTIFLSALPEILRNN